MNIAIRKATIQDLDAVVDVINLASQNLIKKGVHQWQYPCDTLQIKEEIEKGLIFILESNGKIIGSYSMKDIDRFEAIGLNESAKYLYRVVIAPEHQGKKAGDKLIQDLREKNAKEDDIYLDCWAGNDKLKQFYVGNGCSYLGDYPEEDYLISIYCL